MRTTPIPALLALILTLAGGPAARGQSAADSAGRFDGGKMWTFEYPPARYFSETYGFDASPAWFERARLAALRIPGCSAAFVSPHGLVVTNHHCARGAIVRVSRPGETLLDDGFYAPALDAERRIPDYYADQLVHIEDVTDRVHAAVDAADGADARSRAREAVFARLQEELGQRHGADARVEITALYHGGRYSAYVFRRYTDVRLVAAPEAQLGYFGGDADNFTYPRYDLDFAFLRIYGEDGRPLPAEHFFRWSTSGVQEGDAVFVIGNPGPTSRLGTTTSLAFQRDVQLPALVGFLEGHLDVLQAYADAHPAETGVRNQMFSLSNQLKATRGRFDALLDPVVPARRLDAERRFRAAIGADAALRARYADVFDRMAEVQRRKTALGGRYGAFLSLTGPAASGTLRRALAADAYLAAMERGAPADSLALLRERVLRTASYPPDLEARLLAARLALFERFLGAADPITRAALDGRTPREAADRLLERSALADSARAAAALAGGTLTRDDPALALAATFLPAYRGYLAEYQRLLAEEAELAAELGRARFEVYGTDVPPDATFSPRITDGVVQGYAYNGTQAPPFTTFFGLYDRYASFGKGTEWELPGRWLPPPAGLDLRTPLNFVSTADTYGGNSGSPAVTKELALVGLNFDRNLEGLSRDYIYLPERGRNVMVDVRAIREALDDVYDADRIVRELTTGRLFTTEQEADR